MRFTQPEVISEHLVEVRHPVEGSLVLPAAFVDHMLGGGPLRLRPLGVETLRLTACLDPEPGGLADVLGDAVMVVQLVTSPTGQLDQPGWWLDL